MSRTRRAAELVRTDALVVRRVLVGEADLLVTLLTREHGLVSAAARGARRANAKFGALESIHGLFVTLAISEGVDVARLVEGKMTRPRTEVVATTSGIEAAARLLRWARSTVAPRVSEPAAFNAVERALDALDSADAPVGAEVLGGLELLAALGWGLELAACVSCGAPCPQSSSALFDTARGGLVCRACGGGPTLLSADLRRKLGRLREDPRFELDAAEHAIGVGLVDEVIAAHAGGTRRQSPRRS